MAAQQQRPYIPQTMEMLSPEEQAKLKKQVISRLRAVLMPEKQGLLLEKLNRKRYLKLHI